MPKRLPRSILGQPFGAEDIELLDFAGRMITEARGTRQYFAGAFADDGIDTRKLLHELWGTAFKQCPRHLGTVDPYDFQWFFCRQVFDWCAEHLTARESDGEPHGQRGEK